VLDSRRAIGSFPRMHSIFSFLPCAWSVASALVPALTTTHFFDAVARSQSVISATKGGQCFQAVLDSPVRFTRASDWSDVLVRAKPVGRGQPGRTVLPSPIAAGLTQWQEVLDLSTLEEVRSCQAPAPAADPPAATARTTVENSRPKAFPHRIWAACDFEGQTPDYGWFGKPERKNIPEYPGNAIALRAEPGPYQNFSAVMTGINPVPGPRMGKVNHLCVRYHLTGGDSAVFQHFSLTREDNWHVRATALPTGRWVDATMNFTRDARRNDGSIEPFAEGERMDDFKLFAGTPAEAGRYQLLIDDVIFFANDPGLPVEPEPFPNRIIYLAAFDTGEKEKYWPGEFELAEKPPAGAFWRAARAIAQADGKGKWIRLEITPPRPVGATTKLRFRYHLTGATVMTVQVFDATVQDNRHVNLKDLKTNAWTTHYVNFSRDSRRNDGTAPSVFAAGNEVDDLFFFVPSAGSDAVTLFVDEVTLFDAGPTG
jgi:hypothetical protein